MSTPQPVSAPLVAPREHGMLFSGEMVRALLAGQKTQTRRVVTKHNSQVGTWLSWDRLDWSSVFADGAGSGSEYLHVGGPEDTMHRVRPRVQPEDRIWVRETWQYADWTEGGDPFVRYRADEAVRLCVV